MELVATQREFSAYGPSHWVVLGVFVVGAALGLDRTPADRIAGPAPRPRPGGVIVAAFIVALTYKLIQPTMDNSIPLQLCDVAELMAAYALWSQRHWAFALTYYWGLVLSSQALITPDVGTPKEGSPDFPHHLFVTFFALHVLVVWAAIYSRGDVGCGRRWRDYRFAIIATLAWAAFTFTFNAIAGTNYGYLNRKPPTASVLDVLGPWPVYLLIEITIVLIVWALMTWPWERTATRQRKLARGLNWP